MNWKYQIIHGQRAETRYGTTVIVTMKDSDVSLLKCLPKRYASIVTDEDFHAINSGTLTLDLISIGRSETSNSVVLDVVKRDIWNCRTFLQMPRETMETMETVTEL